MMKGLLLAASLALASIVALTALRGGAPTWLVLPPGAIAALFGLLFVMLERSHLPLGLHVRALIMLGSFALIGLGLFTLVFTPFEQALPWTMIISAALALGTAFAMEEQTT